MAQSLYDSSVRKGIQDEIVMNKANLSISLKDVLNMNLEQVEIAKNLRRLLNTEHESYDGFFEELAKAEDFSSDLDSDLLDVLIDVVISETTEFSVRDAVFEIARQFCQFQPLKVFEGFAYKTHNDYLFDGIIIHDLIRLKLDVEEMNRNLVDSPNKSRYELIISNKRQDLIKKGL